MLTIEHRIEDPKQKRKEPAVNRCNQECHSRMNRVVVPVLVTPTLSLCQ